MQQKFFEDMQQLALGLAIKETGFSAFTAGVVISFPLGIARPATLILLGLTILHRGGQQAGYMRQVQALAEELKDTLARKLKDALEELLEVDNFVLTEIQAMDQGKSPTCWACALASVVAHAVLWLPGSFAYKGMILDIYKELLTKFGNHERSIGCVLLDPDLKKTIGDLARNAADEPWCKLTGVSLTATPCSTRNEGFAELERGRWVLTELFFENCEHFQKVCQEYEEDPCHVMNDGPRDYAIHEHIKSHCVVLVHRDKKAGVLTFMNSYGMRWGANGFFQADEEDNLVTCAQYFCVVAEPATKDLPGLEEARRFRLEGASKKLASSVQDGPEASSLNFSSDFFAGRLRARLDHAMAEFTNALTGLHLKCPGCPKTRAAYIVHMYGGNLHNDSQCPREHPVDVSAALARLFRRRHVHDEDEVNSDMMDSNPQWDKKIAACMPLMC